MSYDEKTDKAKRKKAEDVFKGKCEL